MMDSYTHLDMSTADPIEDLRLQMATAGVDRALIVETWGKDNSVCLDGLIATGSSQFRVALCFRPDEEGQIVDLLQRETIAALRVKTADLRHLGSLAASLNVSGKWLLAHAEAGIKMLNEELLPLANLYPGLRIYLPHCGWPRRDKRDDKDWERCIFELSRFPNIIVGISAIDHFSQVPYPHKDIEAFAARILDVFGPDAVAIGSDYPLLKKGTYARCMSLARWWIHGANSPKTSLIESDLFGECDAKV